MKLYNLVWDLGGILMDWNPRYLYENVFQDRQEMDFFLKEVCNGEWNHMQDAGRSWEDGIKVLSEVFPDYAYEIELYYTRWIEMISGSIEENVQILEEFDKKDYIHSYSLTNWSSQTFSLVRNSYSFFDLFLDIIVSGDEKVAKPDPRIYQILTEKHALDPSSIIFIDDRLANTQAADLLGWNTIHYHSGVDLREEINSLISL